ncbi:hypothetical protein [Nocardia arthritidis]|uniref:Uncharacterized protein n=1 Tax=Nocardia arthritidis TaxID=228602 RepID=A0A6G9Y6G2_9NOCA|nr:hypothetical protein [Nocardia arthritidis]QIS08835.1 hypothetical protein F5544_04605 [Nocardia arthritidis]
MSDGDDEQQPQQQPLPQPEQPAEPSPTSVRADVAKGLPRVSLATVLETVEAAYKDGLNPTRSQIAARVGQTTNSGAFTSRMATCMIYGVFEPGGPGSVRITDIALDLFDEHKRPDALIALWMSVPIYRSIFEQYNGKTLPQDTGIESDLIRLGLAPKRASSIRATMMAAAELVGLRATAKDRLVVPASRIPAVQSQAEKKRLDHTVERGPGYAQFCLSENSTAAINLWIWEFRKQERRDEILRICDRLREIEQEFLDDDDPEDGPSSAAA